MKLWLLSTKKVSKIKLLSLAKIIKMDLQARKLSFIQEFIEVKSESIISNIEKFLKLEKELEVEQMSVRELHKRIDASETDFKNGCIKTNEELLEKYK